MRRSIVTMTMLTGLACLSTRLAGQSGGWTAGLGGTLGTSWQVEAADVGYAHVAHAGPVAIVALTARLGSFIDENAILGGARGFVFGATLGVRTSMWQLAELGPESNTSAFGADLTLEATGYVGTNSPLPVGSPWGAVSLLPGLRFGTPDGGQLGLLIGPTVFFGTVTQVRPLLGLRFETALARDKRHS